MPALAQQVHLPTHFASHEWIETMRKRRTFVISLATAGFVVVTLASAGWWYTFVAGAPQLDAAEIPASRDLRFRIESFDSQAMGERRNYGMILPPGYEHDPNRRYPVIMLLHGGHDDGRA